MDGVVLNIKTKRILLPGNQNDCLQAQVVQRICISYRLQGQDQIELVPFPCNRGTM